MKGTRIWRRRAIEVAAIERSSRTCHIATSFPIASLCLGLRSGLRRLPGTPHLTSISRCPGPRPPGHCQHCVVSTSFWSNMPRASLNATTASSPHFWGGWNTILGVEIGRMVKKARFFIMHITTKADAFLWRAQKTFNRRQKLNKEKHNVWNSWRACFIII